MGSNTGGLEDSLRNMILRNSGPSTIDEHIANHAATPTRSGPQNHYPYNGNQRPSQGNMQPFPGPNPSPNLPRNAPQPLPNATMHRHFQPGPFPPTTPRPPLPAGQYSQAPVTPQRFQHNSPQYNSRFHGHPSPGYNIRGTPSSWREHAQVQAAAMDPEAFQRRGHVQQNRLFEPQQQQQQHHHYASRQAMYEMQSRYIDDLASVEIPRVGMSDAELMEKEQFRSTLASICKDVCDADPSNLPSVSLETFGSIRSGFANAGSDMDLVIVINEDSPESVYSSLHERGLPRALEKRLLHYGYGARLLSKTRVPIIKICQKPSDGLLDRLREEREKWDALDHDRKYPDQDRDDEDDMLPAQTPASDLETSGEAEKPQSSLVDSTPDAKLDTKSINNSGDDANKASSSPQKSAKQSIWARERKSGPLDFPKEGVGIQCDINFFNPLGIHNTQLLRCYSLCDPRVRPVILFVKLWAKRRMINSSYSGTLSSYGYVLMVLHYLINVARPPVLPNLQLIAQNHDAFGLQKQDPLTVDNWVVDFWRNEDEIRAAADARQLTQNTESIGSLLVGFFQYYAAVGGGRAFHWTRSVLSLRTKYGILTKEEKGWTKASTEESNGRKVQHRYLFAIEDPFELSHNVARTVTHNGIVAIRDEFRRAHHILHAVGLGNHNIQGLLAPLVNGDDAPGMNPTTNEQSKTEIVPRGPKFPVRQQPSKQPKLDLNSQDLFPALPPVTPKKGQQ